MHFGHCQEFGIVDVDENEKKIARTEMVPPPPHEPGLLPRWLAERDVNVVIAGGMGTRAQALFTEEGMRVVTGAPSAPPDEVVLAFLNGTLEAGENACDH